MSYGDYSDCKHNWITFNSDEDICTICRNRKFSGSDKKMTEEDYIKQEISMG